MVDGYFPYVLKHKEPLLNLSFVLTASAKFNETLDNIVRGLQDAGFSNKDYYAEEIITENTTAPISDKEALNRDLFGLLGDIFEDFYNDNIDVMETISSIYRYSPVYGFESLETRFI